MSRHVAILGAGPAGLATAVELKRRGVAYTLFERGGALAAAMRRIDPEMEILSPTRLSLMPGMPRRASDPAYLRFPAYVEKLEALAKDHAIEVHTGAEVVRVEAAASGFRVRLREGGERTATHVVSAMGMLAHPRLPPGFDPADTDLPWLHSLDFRTSLLADTRRLLVVGGGQSAVEVLERWLAQRRQGDRAWVSLRTPLKALPHWILGIDIHYPIWPFELLPGWALGIDPVTFRDPMLGLAVPRAIRRGSPAACAAFRRAERSAVVLEDGSRIEPDRIVFATGFELFLGPLEPVLARDARGWPRVRACESLQAPGVFVLGLRHGRTLASAYLRGIARDARYVARRIAASAGSSRRRAPRREQSDRSNG